MSIRLLDPANWVLQDVRGPVRGARRSVDAHIPADFLGEGVSIHGTGEAHSTPVRRGEAPPPLDIEAELDDDDGALLVTVSPNGALAFHAPQDAAVRRSAAGAGTRLHFHVVLPPEADAAPAQRSVVKRAVKLVLLKIRRKLIDKVVGIGLAAAARGAELLWWKAAGRETGWVHIRQTAKGLRLERIDAVPGSGQRALVFLHGTFSHTEGSFRRLLEHPDFAAVAARYGGRVYGFQHHTVSRSLENNALDLLAGLPEQGLECDVVTHSRGGLLLRRLAEQPAHFGTLGGRFRLRHGVMVAAPNLGTPLATPSRWEQTVGLVANLIDALPDPLQANPWVMGTGFVADAIVWLAARVGGDIPGLADMNADGPTIRALRDGNGPVHGRYSAIAANYHPTGSLLMRLLDAGVDGFFAGANDLVVPTDGGWGVPRIDADVLPAARVGCFGMDGNLPIDTDVHHLNITAQPQTLRLVDLALAGKPLGLPVFDLDVPRASRRWRGGAGAALSLPALPAPLPPPLPLPEGEPLAGPAPLLPLPPIERERERGVFRLIITPVAGDSGKAQLLALYRGAVVVESMHLRNVASGARAASAQARAGSRFQQIITHHKQIQDYLDGKRASNLSGEEMRRFGENLFDALFVGHVRRLYDAARSEHRGEALEFVFTCTIPWVAAIPWEFIRDPLRRKFLATEEINFVRNVDTPVPAQWIAPRDPPLRMLVVAAQPLGTVPLSLAEEAARIHTRFQPLTRTGRIRIDVLSDATAAQLHDRVVVAQRQGRPFDIVHFIGHGEFDREAAEGRLIVHGADGRAERIGIQSLREILCHRGVRLVFLNACDTGTGSKASGQRGIAQALVDGGLPAVVSNQYKVLDPSALAFAEHFYGQLARGSSLAEAARESRIAVNYAVQGEIIDWAIPVLHARDPDLRLCPPQAEARAEVAPENALRSVPGPQRSTGSLPGMNIGVADLSRFFSELPATLTALNSVQTAFAFQPVQVQVPTGAWVEDRDEGRSYLVAERFAEAVKQTIGDLDVDFLFCITPWWMRNGTTLNIYAWTDPAAVTPLALFSTAGLSLPETGPGAARAIVNTLVAILASSLLAKRTGAPSIHAEGARDCPFYFNAERDPDLVMGPQHFDSECTRLLRRSIGQPLLQALEALLDAFDDRPPGTRPSEAAALPLATATHRGTRKTAAPRTAAPRTATSRGPAPRAGAATTAKAAASKAPAKRASKPAAKKAAATSATASTARKAAKKTAASKTTRTRPTRPTARKAATTATTTGTRTASKAPARKAAKKVAKKAAKKATPRRRQ